MTSSESATAGLAADDRRDSGRDRTAIPPQPERVALARLLDTAPDAVIAVDRQSRITWLNSRASTLVECDGRSRIGDAVESLLSDTSGLDALNACVTGGPPLRDQTLHLAADNGRQVSVSAASAELPGSPNQTLLYLRDVSERMRAEAETVLANAELEHCVNSLAHDLRSPLVALLGFARLLRQDYGEILDETGNHFIDRIDQAGRTMETLVHDLLELSQIGRPGELREMVDPRPLLVQFGAELKPELDAAGLRLEFPDAPPLVYAHRIRLYQVFSNLIGNAIAHSGASSDPRICVDILDDGDVHRIRVSDHGRGIPVESQDRIFDVFQSLPSDPGKKPGAGIGLAIVKKIAQTHGGRVWVESRPGEGAAFHVTLAKRASADAK